MAVRAAGARYLSVATMDEASRLRGTGDRGPILVNYPIPAESLAEAAAAQIDVTAGGEQDLKALEAMAHRSPGVHVEVDTGMGRGGFQPDRVVTVLRRFQERSVPVRAVWTHLASPDDRAATARQVDTFERVSARLRDLGIHPDLRHVAASGGLLYGAPTFDLVRVGLALYGLDPFPDAEPRAHDLRLVPTLSVRARAVWLEDVPAGTPVGYDGTWVASRSSRLATLPIGYVDGWTRASGARTEVLVRGTRCRVVGRISSDSMTVDVSEVPAVDADDIFTLLGRDGPGSISTQEVAAARDTIVWEVLQTMSVRLARIYVLEGSVVAQRSPATMRLSTAIDLQQALERAAADEQIARWGGSGSADDGRE